MLWAPEFEHFIFEFLNLYSFSDLSWLSKDLGLTFCISLARQLQILMKKLPKKLSSRRPSHNKTSVSTKRESISEAVNNIWIQLFESSIHLDSALSKQPKHLK